MNEEKKQKRVEKEVIKKEKEIKRKSKQKAKEEKKRTKKVDKELRKVASDKEEIMEIKKKRYILQTIIIVFFAIIMLILLCNRTFFREEYNTQKINIDIPLLTFFIKDDGNEVVLKTLRKSEYLREYFDSYLSTLTRYNCDNGGFYYDTKTQTAIYEISVEKNIAVKTIKIRYANGEADCLCNGTSNC